MTEESVYLQINQVMATFMNFRLKDTSHGIKWYRPGDHNYTVEQMKFHTEWNWLIPVYQKAYKTIRKMAKNKEWETLDYHADEFRCRLENNCHQMIADNNIRDLHQMIFQCISYINKRKR